MIIKIDLPSVCVTPISSEAVTLSDTELGGKVGTVNPIHALGNIAVH